MQRLSPEGTSISTTLDYILTKEEEKKIVDTAISQKMKNYRWKLTSSGCPIQTIELKLKSVDWEKEINREELLRTANKNRHFEIWQKESQEKRRQEELRKRQEIEERCNADFFRVMMKSKSLDRKGKFIENKDTTPLIDTVCYFMSRDQKLETLGYSLNKGLLLRGTCGLGKTYLFDLVSQNPRLPVNIYSLIEIAEIVQQEGYFRPNMNGILYLDDLGSENHLINHYGTKINWFKDFFEKFYLRSKRYDRLVVSTNLSFDELEVKYGYRFRSRVKEVFNIVNVTGEDLRN